MYVIKAEGGFSHLLPQQSMHTAPDNALSSVNIKAHCSVAASKFLDASGSFA